MRARNGAFMKTRAFDNMVRFYSMKPLARSELPNPHLKFYDDQ